MHKSWTQLLLAYVTAHFLCAPAVGEFFLTAEVAPTIGLDGFETYRITANSDLGNVVGFDFSEVGFYGVSGPIHQINPFGVSTVFDDVAVDIFNFDNTQDTRFLFKSNDIVSVFPTESNNSLHGAFALAGDRQLTIGNSVPFLQIATAASSQVNLKGSFVVRRPNDSLVEFAIDMPLSSILIGAPPQLNVLPVPEPVLPVAPIAPSLPAPVYTPPALPAPVPVFGGGGPTQTPNPPPGPMAPPASPIQDGRIFLTAEVAPTVGREGFNTYRITATSNLGGVVGVDLSEVGNYGLFGPIGQVNPLGTPTVFADQLNSAFDPRDPSQDTQFLVRSDDVVSLFTNESENGLHGIFALMGDRQFTAGQSLPFLQVSTADPSQVTLKGSLMIRRADGLILEDKFDLNQAGMQIGAAPVVDLLPIPEPVVIPAPPPIVTSPPVVGPVRPELIGDLPTAPTHEGPQVLPFPIATEPMEHPVTGDPSFDPELISIFRPGEPIGAPEFSYWQWNWPVLSIDPGEFQIIDVTNFHPDLQPHFTEYVDLPYTDLVSAFAEDGAGYFRRVHAAMTTNFRAVQQFSSTAFHLTSHDGFSDLGSNSLGAPEPTSVVLLLFGAVATVCVVGRRPAR